MTVRVTDRCQGCGACLLTCPEHALRPHGGPLIVLDDLCTGCLECLEVCPVDAIEERRADERAEWPRVGPGQALGRGVGHRGRPRGAREGVRDQ